MDEPDYLLWLPQTKLTPPRPHAELCAETLRLWGAGAAAAPAAPITSGPARVPTTARR